VKPQDTERADALVRRSAEHVFVDVDDDLSVVLQTATGVYYELNHVSQRIWALTAHPISVRALSEAMIGEYSVERKRCETDVSRFLDQLVNAGLVTVTIALHAVRRPAQ
jgi:hypothetical protein